MFKNNHIRKNIQTYKINTIINIMTSCNFSVFLSFSSQLIPISDISFSLSCSFSSALFISPPCVAICLYMDRNYHPKYTYGNRRYIYMIKISTFLLFNFTGRV